MAENYRFFYLQRGIMSMSNYCISNNVSGLGMVLKTSKTRPFIYGKNLPFEATEIPQASCPRCCKANNPN
jgi:hypothetical protein